MAKNRIFRSVLLAAGALLIAACASRPAPEGSLSEKQFQRAAKQYQKFERDGQSVYCMMANTKIIPHTCLSESELRKQVDDYERSRNAVAYTRSPPG
jgi:PBP1b-binding outer membrane lipoprotein LpoB